MPLPSGGTGLALVLTAVIVLALIAFLPTLIAAVRGAEIADVLVLFLLNILACPTIIGWFILLGFAVKWPTRRDLTAVLPTAQPAPQQPASKAPGIGQYRSFGRHPSPASELSPHRSPRILHLKPDYSRDERRR
ncbi:superinfection immunity protein [Actinomadura harenae]|uniref:Superinfection immunity protein n=1 Tax=Actinomadura harenae TaxID=2483351 RepID=A0A3M2M4D6_9ACTN|nr:superinfection immunity protein [Actinomadura harenae]RMI43910.1 hypothetical protein EBO15_14500 [Actinomadura harenae]